MVLCPCSLEITGKNTFISLTWTAPFTLDISTETEDISYCVDVFISTLIYTECGISTTQFQYAKPNDSVCHNYTFTVTPVNVVGNGPSTIMSYFEVETSKFLDYNL